MLDFAQGFLMRSAVMVPVLMIIGIGAWTALRKLQMMRLDEPFDAATDLGNFGVAQPSGPDISRDGMTMVFSGYPDNQSDIYIMTRHCE